MQQDIFVTYKFPENLNPANQAKIIAMGQTAGTWDAKWEHVGESFKKHIAEVVDVKESEATIRFPAIDFEGDLAGLLTIIFGKYSMASPAKVIDIKLPENFGTPYKFGQKGIRELTQVYDRPFVMAIFKPALGLNPKQHADILREVAFAGLDIIKDDEIMGNIESATTFKRLEECRKVMDELKKETGKNLLYAINVTGRVDKLLQRARDLVSAGANAIIINAFTYGLSVVEALAADEKVNVPIFTHPAFAGAMALSENTGLSYPTLLGTLLSYTGADAVLYPAHYGNLPFTQADEISIMNILKTKGVLAVPSAGIHPGVVPAVLKQYGQDVVLNAGTGIMDHPTNPAEGVNAFFQALEEAEPGKAFNKNEVKGEALKSALAKWAA